jgi:hypothetical protein
MRSKHGFTWIGLGLAAFHLLLVWAIWSQHYEGSWGGFLLFLIDFPISILIVVPSSIYGKWVSGWIAFGIVGTLWWYFFPLLASYVLRAVLRKN